MGTPAIELNGFRKSYGDTVAVDGVDLRVEQQEVFGLLGPNGAGKTTTIRTLTTLLPPDEGQCRVFGTDVTTAPRSVRRRIGVIQQEVCFEPYLTVRENVRTYGYLCGLADPELRERCDRLLSTFEIDEAADRKAVTLSTGQKRRLQVAREFLRDPDLLFLDEPTVGLDPEMREALLGRIERRVADGLTVCFTTHNLREAERLCDRVGFLVDGKLIETQSVAAVPTAELEEYYLSVIGDRELVA